MPAEFQRQGSLVLHSVWLILMELQVGCAANK